MERRGDVDMGKNKMTRKLDGSFGRVRNSRCIEASLAKRKRRILYNDPSGSFQSGSFQLETLSDLPKNPISDGGIFVSSAELDDGRYLVVWVDGSSIKQGYAPRGESLRENGSVENITTVLMGMTEPWCILSKLDNGLYLTVNYAQKNSDKIAKSLLYKSSSGNGGDWTLHATVSSVDWGSDGYLFGEILGAGITKIGNKYLGGFMWLYDGIGINTGVGSYYSEDMVNWTLNKTWRGSYGTTEGCSSNFLVAPDGYTYFTFSASHAFDGFYVYRSNDGFISNRECILYMDTTINYLNDEVPKRCGWLEYDEANGRILVIASNDRDLIISSLDPENPALVVEVTRNEVLPYRGAGDGSLGVNMCNLGDGRFLIWTEDDSFELLAGGAWKGVSI